MTGLWNDMLPTILSWLSPHACFCFRRVRIFYNCSYVTNHSFYCHGWIRRFYGCKVDLRGSCYKRYGNFFCKQGCVNRVRIPSIPHWARDSKLVQSICQGSVLVTAKTNELFPGPWIPGWHAPTDGKVLVAIVDLDPCLSICETIRYFCIRWILVNDLVSVLCEESIIY